MPAACATYLATTLPLRLVIGWCVATLARVAGLYASFKMVVPTGAAIVCARGLALLVAAVLQKFLRRT